MLITMSIRMLDVLKNLLIASKIGVSGSADIFFSLQLLPDFLVILIGIDTIKGVANSEYSSLFSIGERDKIKNSISVLLKYLVIVSLFLVVLIVLLRAQILKILLPGLNETSYLTAISISVFIFPVFFVKSVTSLLQPFYNSQKRFYLPIMAQIVITLSVVLSVFLPPFQNKIIFNFSIAFLIGNSIYLIILLIPLLKELNIKDFWNYKIDKTSVFIIKSCGAIFVHSLINQLYLFSRNFYVSYFPEGSLSALNYGASIPAFVTTLTFNIVFGILLTNLSSLFSAKDFQSAKRVFFDTFSILVFLFIPIVVLFVLFSDQILSLIYLRGNFDINGILYSKKPFIWESLALLTYLLYIIPTSLFLALKKYKFLTIVGSSVYLTGIILNYFFTGYFGFYGVSISTFVVSGLYGLILFLKMRSVFDGILSELIRPLKFFVSGILSVIIIYFIKDFASGQFTFGLTVVNLLVYLSLAFLLVSVIYFIISYILEPAYIKKMYSAAKGKMALWLNKNS